MCASSGSSSTTRLGGPMRRRVGRAGRRDRRRRGIHRQHACASAPSRACVRGSRRYEMNAYAAAGCAASLPTAHPSSETSVPSRGNTRRRLTPERSMRRRSACVPRVTSICPRAKSRPASAGVAPCRAQPPALPLQEDADAARTPGPREPAPHRTREPWRPPGTPQRRCPATARRPRCAARTDRRTSARGRACPPAR